MPSAFGDMLPRTESTAPPAMGLGNMPPAKQSVWISGRGFPLPPTLPPVDPNRPIVRPGAPGAIFLLSPARTSSYNVLAENGRKTAETGNSSGAPQLRDLFHILAFWARGVWHSCFALRSGFAEQGRHSCFALRSGFAEQGWALGIFCMWHSAFLAFFAFGIPQPISTRRAARNAKKCRTMRKDAERCTWQPPDKQRSRRTP